MTNTEIERDELGDMLVAKGLVPNTYILDMNGSLTVPHTFELPAPWNLPSRLFRFPIAVEGRGEGRRIALAHPLLADHPFAQLVAAEVGTALDPDGVDEPGGFSSQNHGTWWHAVDLISSGHWRELLETRHFTTPGDIAGAVAYGLDYSSHEEGRKRNGHITTAEAREIMRAIGVDEPGEVGAMLADFMRPMSCKSDRETERWPINHTARDRRDRAWGRIIGIERGWFGYDRSGFLQWTPAGRERHAAGAAPTFVEASGQAAFAF